MAEVVAYVTDLMDRSRIAAAVPEARFVRRFDDVTSAPVVVLDLSLPGALEAIAPLVAAGTRVVAYGSHVNVVELDDARRQGAEVYPRSVFFARTAGILA